MMKLNMRSVSTCSEITTKPFIQVLTYNVLAQCYTRSKFYPYCSSAALKWKTRSKNLEKFIQSLPLDAHIICLQEVDNYAEFWQPSMKRWGYAGIYARKTKKYDGVAIFWNMKTIDLIHHECIDLNSQVEDEPASSDDLLLRAIRGSVGLIGHFQLVSEDEIKQNIIIATTHLFWDPDQEDVKLIQTYRMLSHLRRFCKQYEISNDTPTILSGDFNSLPNSVVYNYITKDNGFHSAYATYNNGQEPEFTNVNGEIYNGSKKVSNFIGTLDYIFYNNASCIYPTSLLEIISLEQATKEISLPSTISPSDHLPLACTFHLKTTQD